MNTTFICKKVGNFPVRLMLSNKKRILVSECRPCLLFSKMKKISSKDTNSNNQLHFKLILYLTFKTFKKYSFFNYYLIWKVCYAGWILQWCSHFH